MAAASFCRVADHEPNHFELVLSTACPISDCDGDCTVGMLRDHEAGQVRLALTNGMMCINLLICAITP